MPVRLLLHSSDDGKLPPGATDKRNGIESCSEPLVGVTIALCTPCTGRRNVSRCCCRPGRDTYKIFVVSPSDHHILQAAVLLVDAVLLRIHGVVEIGIRFKGSWVLSGVVRQYVASLGIRQSSCLTHHNLILRELASNDKSVTNDIPASFTSEKVEEFAKIMNKSRHLHPLWLAILSHGFGGLQEVFDLSRIGVRIGRVHKLVEHLHGLPDTHDRSRLFERSLSGCDVEGDCLLGVLFADERRCQFEVTSDVIKADQTYR